MVPKLPEFPPVAFGQSPPVEPVEPLELLLLDELLELLLEELLLEELLLEELLELEEPTNPPSPSWFSHVSGPTQLSPFS